METKVTISKQLMNTAMKLANSKNKKSIIKVALHLLIRLYSPSSSRKGPLTLYSESHLLDSGSTPNDSARNDIMRNKVLSTQEEIRKLRGKLQWTA